MVAWTASVRRKEREAMSMRGDWHVAMIVDIDYM
jgi:hypothetical protein